MRSSPTLLGCLCSALVACPSVEPEPDAEIPAPDAWGPLAGPGGPAQTYDEDELFEVCAYLDGGPEDQNHHNNVVMFDGHLFMPWAPEWSNGGVSVFEFDDPCNPVKVGETEDTGLREPHNMGISRVNGRTYAALDYHGGIIDGEITGGVQFWDLTDPTDPVHVGDLGLPGYVYPDSYALLSASVFWQGTVLYVSGADNGFWMVDVSDPEDPVYVGRYAIEPTLRVGAVHVVGDVALVSSFEGARTVLLDVSDPYDPQPIPGGEFVTQDADGNDREYYFANIGGPWALFARKDGGAGFMAYDISDPRDPQPVIQHSQPMGGGGYVARHHGFVFVGEGDSGGGGIYDARDPDNVSQLGRVWIAGDLDFLTPVGNVAAPASDEDAIDGQATGVAPWATEPDSQPPQVQWHRPADGATNVATTMRIGVSFDENVDFASVFEGSFVVTDAEGQPVPGRYSGQETVVSFEPDGGFAADTTYEVRLPEGGIIDASGNPTGEDATFRFSTGPTLQ